ncbi:MAG: dihydroorotase [Pseudomonadota bacterium]
MTDTLTITQPDDWHIHLRDSDALPLTVADVSRQFARAIVMPNLTPPVITTEAAHAYRERILSQIPDGQQFDPLMTLYLTDRISTDELTRAKESGIVYGVKLYPAGATTNSQDGVQNLSGIFPLLAHMERINLPLLIHGEVANPDHDIFDREHLFLEQHLREITQTFPNLRVVLEHITTQEAVEFVQQASSKVAATITAHHLLYNRNHMLNGGIRPHYYCLPILKRSSHQTALINAATSGNPKFFLGTDSAPHAQHKKETDCGCAGCYTAYAAIEMYAEVFEAAGALDKLEGFASHFGADFYQLPRNSSTITLKRTTWTAPASLALGNDTLIPLRANETLPWKVDYS